MGERIAAEEEGEEDDGGDEGLESRLYLAAMEEREAELEEGDPRKAKLQLRLEKVKAKVKKAGGRTFQRLIYSILGANKSIDTRARAIVEAESELEEAKKRAEKAKEEEEEAAEKVQRCTAQHEGEKLRHASLAFEAAIEASVGIDGYEELERAVADVGEVLGSVGAIQVEGQFATIAGFV